MRHIVPCCKDGWIETADAAVPPMDKLQTDRGMIELLGIAYRHDDGSLTVVPFDDPYLGDLGRQSLLMIHEHICREVERMQKTPPPPPRPVTTTDPVVEEAHSVKDPLEFLRVGDIRLYFGYKGNKEYYEHYLVGGYFEPLTRENMRAYIKQNGPIIRLFVNDQPEPDIARFLRILQNLEVPASVKPFMDDEFRPSSN